MARFNSRSKLNRLSLTLRPTVSLSETSTYNILGEILPILKHSVDSCENSVTSSTQFLDGIKDIQINNDEFMAFFDVTALFTSVEPKLVKKFTSLLFINYSNLLKHIKLLSKNLLDLINMRLTTYI
ncbi:reverse transcriptase [Schistosoma japonicum]|uniref:Reverse transcriptase n=1 Tax=Schistosoma japonicum TaxID=6182 RepID=A0A4Z2DC40_SCHJA|nr:reverse transcriptase [Schistosoma japonicum]